MLGNGSDGRTRTCDPVINSHLLYRLSYIGIPIPRVEAERGIEPLRGGFADRSVPISPLGRRYARASRDGGFTVSGGGASMGNLLFMFYNLVA